jgi:PST family polysaccharide transporter
MADGRARTPDGSMNVRGGEGPQAEAGDKESLDRSLVRGFAWTSGVKWSTQLLTWVSTLVVVRLLTPEDYGLVGMAGLFLGLVQMASEFGFGYAVVILRDLTGKQVSQLHGAALLFGVVAFLLTLLVAHPIGLFFDSARLPAVVAVSGVNFLLSSLRPVPQGLLQRDLRFRLLAVIEGGRALITAAATVLMAAYGFGYWALILGGLLGNLVDTVWTALYRWVRIEAPKFDVIRGALTVGGDVTGVRFAWYGYSNADFLIVGKVMGEGPLGIYTVAWTLASLPVEKLTALVGRVAGPVFAAAKHDRALLRRYFLRLTEAIALVVFPASVGLALVAPDFVDLVIGHQWSPGVLPLQILCLSVLVRSIDPILSTLLLMQEETRFAVKVATATVILLPLAFLIGSRWGLAGVAVGWITVYPLMTLPLLLLAVRKGILTLADYANALMPATMGCVTMSGIVILSNRLYIGDLPTWIRFGADIGIGAAAYGSLQLLFFRKRIRHLLGAVRLLRKGPVVASDGDPE